ncbi:MAG: imidazole glycerol phosphate synthase cyclase subunit [Balneolaceae bacterium]|nr:MAG: imidazole glycerol phosphate synthase cyclase subunit [Balneolaceae bacterium]
MLAPRIIPCLLVKNKGLVKTISFDQPTYVGDPLNAVRIFNEKKVDELMVLDIDASALNREPDYRMIEHLAMECRMPLCYGGGIKTVEQAERIFALGVEKIAISSAAVDEPDFIAELAARVGNQSVIVVLDVKKRRFGYGYEIRTHNASRKSNRSLTDFIRLAETKGAGEIVVNSIDRDGTMKGYDLKLAGLVRDLTTLPITILGGAGSLNHLGDLISAHGIIGCAAGSLFVFKGKYRAVLISYPPEIKKIELLNSFISNS